MGAPEYLAAGLASNTTLRKFCLEDAKNLDDASSASIVQALSSHPAVEVLELGLGSCPPTILQLSKALSS